MNAPKDSHYDALGISRDARHADIVRAHERLVDEFRKDTTPPDARREARIREAFAVLSDEERRADYDRSLVAAPRTFDRRRAGAVAGVVVVLVAVAAYLFLGRGAPQGKPGRSAQEIRADVVSSVGRVQSFDMSGKGSPAGIAFTIAKGVMATTCEGLAPGAQLVVTIGKRAVPARIAMADEALGLCKLAVDGAGSWPLTLGGTEPKAGDKVYAAGVNAAGEVVLAEGTVKRVLTGARPGILEANVPVEAAMGGRPLLDVQGRVVGVATASQPGGAARHMMVPSGWADESAAPAAPPVEPAPSLPKETGSMQAPRDPVQGVAEEAARKLGPLPKVPADH